MIYLVKLVKGDKQFLKVGFTKHSTTSRRFYPYRKFFDSVELLKTFNSKDIDYKVLEVHLHEYKLPNYRIDTGLDFGGKNECYELSHLEKVTAIIDKMQTSPKYALNVLPTHKRPLTDFDTSLYYEEDEVIETHPEMLHAQFWISPQGDKIKLTQNFKAIYHYRLDQFNSFAREDKPYMESLQTIADNLSVCLDSVKDIQALMKRMGLLKHISNKIRDNRYYVFEPCFVEGYLINERLNTFNS